MDDVHLKLNKELNKVKRDWENKLEREAVVEKSIKDLNSNFEQENKISKEKITAVKKHLI